MALACPPAVPRTCTSEFGNHAKRRNTHWESLAFSNQRNLISISAHTQTLTDLTNPIVIVHHDSQVYSLRKTKKVQIPNRDPFLNIVNRATQITAFLQLSIE